AVVKADYTFTLALPKIGLYISPGRELAGYTEIIPIGIPDGVVKSFNIKENLITAEIAAALLPKRKPDGHKGDFGKLFILAGSTSLTGAAAMAANASARSGVGLVTVGCPQSLNHILEMKLTEPMTYPLPDVGKKGALAKRGLGEIKMKIAENDAVIIGPGIGRHFETRDLIQKLVASLDKPAIIDADGLNAFEKDRSGLEGGHSDLVLTPHPGEFRRLIDENIPGDLNDKFELVRKYARRYKAVIVYKGSPSVVVDLDGQAYLNPTGNDGMATGGTGDVLSGIIGSFLAQGMKAADAAICGTYIHGLAGDLAAAEYGRRSLIAGDLIEFLPDAFRILESYL
ncbi:MAG: NAD(P)H-hydrate dehydratase, partial [Candidatus Zixiibacteriota bacterium]